MSTHVEFPSTVIEIWPPENVGGQIWMTQLPPGATDEQFIAIHACMVENLPNHRVFLLKRNEVHDTLNRTYNRETGLFEDEPYEEEA